MPASRYQGIFAATLTPFSPGGDVQLEKIGPLCEHLIERGVAGFYVCGSTGEGVSLTIEERKSVAAEFVQAAGGRVPVMVQVGHNSLREARGLAAHAAQIGAAAASATCTSYFKVNQVETLVACMAEVAGGAPDLPFYYYHIPSLTGNRLNMPTFLRQAAQQIPNLVGMKYTTTEIHDFQQCLEMEQRRFEVLWGVDEMLLAALSVGGNAAIGSTYNIAAPLYQRILHAFAAGDLPSARMYQLQAVEMIAILIQYPFHAALKFVVKEQGVDLGGCRLPQVCLSSQQQHDLQRDLSAIGFWDWSSKQ